MEKNWHKGIINGSAGNKLFVYVFKAELSAVLREKHPDNKLFKKGDMVAIKIRKQDWTREEFGAQHDICEIRHIPQDSSILSIDATPGKRAIYMQAIFMPENISKMSFYNHCLGFAYSTVSVQAALFEGSKKYIMVVLPKRDTQNKIRNYLEITAIIGPYEPGMIETRRIKFNDQVGLIRQEDSKYFYVWDKEKNNEYKLKLEFWKENYSGLGNWILFKSIADQGKNIFVNAPIYPTKEPDGIKTRIHDKIVQICVECTSYKWENGKGFVKTKEAGMVKDTFNLLSGMDHDIFPIYLWLEPEYDSSPYLWRISKGNIHLLEKPKMILSPVHPFLQKISSPSPTLSNEKDGFRSSSPAISMSTNGESNGRTGYAKLSLRELCQEMLANKNFARYLNQIAPDLYEAFEKKLHRCC